MKTVRFFWLLAIPAVLSASLFLSSCSEDDDDDKDEPTTEASSPEITIISPTAGSTIDGGKMVEIKAEIKHSENIHEYSYEIKNVSTDKVIVSESEHIHDQEEIVIEVSWMNNVEDHSDMMLTVKASDHNDRVTMESVSFHCHPADGHGGHGGHGNP